MAATADAVIKAERTIVAVFQDRPFVVDAAAVIPDLRTLQEQRTMRVLCTDLASSRCERTCVIVTSPLADEALWAEVLNRGGFDVLAQPLDSNEVIRTVQAAFRRSKMLGDHPPIFSVTALAAG